MFSLTDLCLNRITEDPARCLRRGEETQPALLRPASDTFLRCEPQSIHRDRWAAVESSTSAARRRPKPEATNFFTTEQLVQVEQLVRVELRQLVQVELQLSLLLSLQLQCCVVESAPWLSC